MKIFTLGVKRLRNSLVKKRVQSLLETIIRLENIPQRSQIKKTLFRMDSIFDLQGAGFLKISGFDLQKGWKWAHYNWKQLLQAKH